MPRNGRTALAKPDAAKADDNDCVVPRAVPRATWQPGIVPNSYGKRPLLNGESVPGAYAANDVEGWVQIADGVEFEFDPFSAGDHRRHGRVELTTDRD